MIEQGIVMLVQAGLSSPPTASGGFFTELPKDAALPSWTYRSISNVSYNALQSFTGFSMRRLQIDCYGDTGADVIALGQSIDVILNGFKGNLPDTPPTFVSVCLQTDLMDFFDEVRRSFRRMLEYEIYYSSN